MTSDRDLQRLLDGFYADGPMEVPDHVFDEAIRRVGRQRQRPAWRLPLGRVPTMSTPARVLLATLLLAALAGGTVLLSGGRTPQPPPTSTRWPGAVHLEPGAPMITLPPATFDMEPVVTPDDRDAPVDWADITGFHSSIWQWSMTLADLPPRAGALTAASTVLTYGLVFDRNGDGVADVVVGIANDAPRAGEFRVWMTDLATGLTKEQLGPPYGVPVEFQHPDERQRPAMTFSFLTGGAPGLRENLRFYGWSSVAVNGEVVAWDYAPDAAWLGYGE